MSDCDRARWQEHHRSRDLQSAPSAFVATHVRRLEARGRGARALDLACGAGRHALLLARHGFATVAVDYAAEACHRVVAAEPAVSAAVADARALPFRTECFTVVVQTRFLDRAIVGDLLRLLVPRGVLLVETFLVAQHQATGHPRREFCLAPGELVALCTTTGVRVRVDEAREGPVEESGRVAHLAAIAVCKL